MYTALGGFGHLDWKLIFRSVIYLLECFNLKYEHFLLPAQRKISKIMNVNFGFAVIFCIAISMVSASRVLELGDKFIEHAHEGQWLVKFYAPWCAHCRRLEPVWAHVAQALHSSPIRVGKADCTRFQALAMHFKVSAYPTILFIKDGERHVYSGERSKEELVTYANRMSRPAVEQLGSTDSLQALKDSVPLFFTYVGDRVGLLWNMYLYHAQKYQPDSWFYSISHDAVKRAVPLKNETAVFVYKDDEASFFEVDTTILEDADRLNSTLGSWIECERFGTFPKVTRSNMNELMRTGKFLVLVVVAENKLMHVTPQESDFRDMVEGIIRKNKASLHSAFQFGWIGSPDLSHSITMSVLSTPHLVVVNSTTGHHHIPDDDPTEMTPEAVHIFLKQVFTESAPRYGGNSFLTRLYRVLFEARTTLGDMWAGNPVLTALVFGLPLGFLSLICYSIFCADILDADEEEHDDDHEKKD